MLSISLTLSSVDVRSIAVSSREMQHAFAFNVENWVKRTTDTFVNRKIIELLFFTRVKNVVMHGNDTCVINIEPERSQQHNSVRVAVGIAKEQLLTIQT